MVPSPSEAGSGCGSREHRTGQVRAEEVRLLYANANAATLVTVVAALVLGGLQWSAVPSSAILGWFAFMLLVSGARFKLARSYSHASTEMKRAAAWETSIAVGAGLSGTGWGAAGILLYPEGSLENQIFLVFVVGGMMLGGASLLAPRPQAFLAFLIPSGLLPTLRFLLSGDRAHLAMGLLAGIFTVVTVTTTWRIHRTVHSSLNLRFENADLVEDLRVAKEQTEALNLQLERRVLERTAELNRSTEQLRAEIEQRRQAEEELLRARKLESLGVLAGGIAHDFNNFLTVVQGNLGLVKIELDRGNPVDDMLDQITRACGRAASLASQLLTFGKGSAPVRRLASVAKLITDNVNLARAGANIGIDLAIAHDLWPAEIDASQMSHAFRNILLNAREAMPDGGIIEVRAENAVTEPGSLPLPAGRYVRISVRDYGSGIPPDILPRVFDPYFTTKKVGSGLGLATAHAIVSKHQGTITVQSKVGLETCFSVYLPASGESLPEAAHGEGLQRGTGRVLIMDDEAALRTLLQRMLEGMGYAVECAADGAEAIARFETAKASGGGFDIVLLDLTVPGGMGGQEAAPRIREIDSSVKLIVSSGYSEAAVMSNYRQYGFDEVLPKPWTLAQLSELFKRVLVSDPERTNH